ncbi:helix-turn-helix transcriptional regulator [Micromonospora sp. L31]|uniref:helix-turn-helix transcriptional regulator n=1 Tax=Micromonospora sp. L31 TaxID=3452213 RepID=UPI003F8B891B
MELVGVSEIREMLGGVSRQRASVIANQRNFPEPIAVLAMGKVWRKSDVEKWIKQHRPDSRD